MSDNSSEPATPDDLRQFEAKVGARFQAVNARFIAVDGRFATLGDRLNEIEQQLQALARRSEARCKVIDRSIDTAQARLEQVQVDLASQIDHARRHLGRIVILGLYGTTIITAILCLCTILLSL